MIAFELISRTALSFVLGFLAGAKEPLQEVSSWYVLLEIATARDQVVAEEELEAFLADCAESGLVRDGIAARSGPQRDELWALRHNISDAQKLGGASIKNDISVPVSRVGDFIREASELVTAVVPGTRVVAFGHVGDGNIHFNLTQPQGMDPGKFLELWETLTCEINAIAIRFGGSFSAEHGIGLLKAPELRRLRGGIEFDLMRTIKQALDPDGIMNPGKILGD